ncbi:CatB-related O-acetyltransferase [Flavivirga rizhaonensis]|uniref:Glycosyltransferase n=1 Tax=Flavivirga rizhaonensis TaxID=2559571 RepID=A0A4S1E341_9FLAO|nr:CatB-related O-acetyltransferase [Flavivirga rizhaonensis]TGV04418.1 glycosyltransferase [Flavivirga rizhaonensis]
MKLAPIVLFTYNRPMHTQKALDALAANPEAEDSELYVFCDGAKTNANITELNNIKNVVKIAKSENRFKKVHVHVNSENKGLANSIIGGVTEIVNKHGRIIVLEDDLETSSGFLKYMNNALETYKDEDEVMHVSGYMYPHDKTLPETFFFNVPLCWGWATWSSAWKHFNADAFDLWEIIKNKNLYTHLDKFGYDYLSSQLAHNISGRLNTWFIKWHASVLIQNGFTLYPNKSLVENIGFDNSGVHNGIHTEFKNNTLSTHIEVEKRPISENKDAENIIRSFYKKLKEKPVKQSLKKQLKNKLKDFVFLVFPNLRKVIRLNHEVLNVRSYLGHFTKVYPPSRLSDTIIGNYTYISEKSIINNVIIGKFCSIGTNFMAGRGMHPTKSISTHPMFYSTGKQNGMTLSKDDKIREFLTISIGNDVFIGMNVTVLDGVKIEDGAIIGAGAVVSRDIPAYAIAVGNPAKVVKYRFEDKTINKLLDIKWWDFKDENLFLIEKYFFEIETFIKKVEEEGLTKKETKKEY